MQTLVGTKKGQIYHLEINRPKQLNTMSKQLFQDLKAAVDIINQTDDVRVVVFTGRGKHFCAGLDLKEAPSMFQVLFKDILKSIRIYNLIKDWQLSMTSLSRIRVPVIVGIQGCCFGGAIDLITSADIKYCSEDSKFSIKEIDIGMAADIGTLQRLGQQNANTSLFRELAYTGRIFDAQEALHLGLVSKVVKNDQLNDEIIKLAEVIAAKSPVGIYTIKSILTRESNLDSQLEVMARTNMSLGFTNDMPTGITALITKSKAEFPKL
ncbi:unnamed protein product (macronuclear) [Paramecium tetraurelia]|uniref:Enoyl-CoA hydratase n=1 Tax=Paramecium tetraurelia TaxID=5888 RepID=A0E1C1_PARTE|nr:uncharacterized protein GSPATT00022257001 [Paramecium tetraurelia]CAK89088.1 unnamed protein product [Paramecium tetraurelia]|eukprot:XP_001456485.1 hypothetical protein (macronuclear) [Paramecium tetraurelia strain d4-2]